MAATWPQVMKAPATAEAELRSPVIAAPKPRFDAMGCLLVSAAKVET